MVAGAHGDAFLVERLADVLGAALVEHERQHAGLLGRRADHAQAGHARAAPASRSRAARARSAAMLLMPMRRSGSRAPRRGRPRRRCCRCRPRTRPGGAWNVVFSNVTSAIMLPPPCQGGMASSTLGLAVDDADAGRAEHLVAGEHEEVAVERLHVDRHVRDRLRAVDHARWRRGGAPSRPSPRPA